MPNVLKAVFGGDSMPFIQEMHKMEAAAQASATKIQRSFDSTLLNAKGPANPGKEYTAFWKQALAEREQAETQAAVRQAARNNKAAALWRERRENRENAPILGPSREEFDAAQIEQAARDNKARALRRKRREERTSEWREEMAQMRRAGVGDFKTGGVVAPAAVRGGFRARLGVAGSMFTSVARDSATSLASGAPITQVIAQQAPQVLQALSLMRLGWVAVGLAVAGVGAYITGKVVKGVYDSIVGTKQLDESMDGLARATDRFRVRMEQAALARKLLSAAAFKDAERGLSASDYDEDAKDAALERNKEQLKAEFLAQKELGFKQTELELEKELLKLDLARNKEKLEAAKLKQKESVEVLKAQAALDETNAKLDEEDAAAAKRIEEAKKKTPLSNGLFSMSSPEERQAREAALREAMNQNEQEQQKLLADRDSQEKDLAEAKRRNGQAAIDRAQAAVTRTENEINTPEKVKSESKPTRAGGSYSPNLTANQQIGAFAFGPQLGLLDVNKSMDAKLAQIVKNTSRGGSGPDYLGGLRTKSG